MFDHVDGKSFMRAVIVNFAPSRLVRFDACAFVYVFMPYFVGVKFVPLLTALLTHTKQLQTSTYFIFPQYFALEFVHKCAVGCEF